MAVSTKMGGKQPRKLPGMIIMMVGKPKDAGSPGEPASDPDEPDADDMPPAGAGSGARLNPDDYANYDSPDYQPPAPGAANFHDQRKLCSNCKAFDSQGAGGVGACLKKVPEADFTISDPDASSCDIWGAQDQRSAQSAAQTGASVTGPSKVPATPDSNPPAA